MKNGFSFNINGKTIHNLSLSKRKRSFIKMKRCGKCGNENADDMRFCLECGNQLPDAPIVVNIGDTTQKQGDLKTDSFGQSVNTQVGGGGQYAQPPFAAANRPRRSNTKIFLAVGGIVALLLLLMTAVGADVVYNMMNSGETVYVKPTPSPDASRTASPEESATPKVVTTPKTSKTPTLPEADDPNVTVKFDGINVDYNVRQNGKLGMKMTVNFTVTGLKDKDSYLAIHFQTRDGDSLPANPGDYRDVKGNLAAFQTLKPDYDETLYKDLELFMPYDEFDLPAGRHELKMDVDLLDGDGIMLEHMAFNDFWYEQK
jgi:hypothetical protein